MDLAMEFTESDTKAYSAQEVLENLEQTVIDFLGQGNTNISAGGFPAERLVYYHHQVPCQKA